MKTLIFTLFIAFPLIAFSQVNGAIHGKVLDKASGEELPFANIKLEVQGKILNAVSSDMGGYYKFKGIAPGKYDIRASYIGYKEVLVKGIMVNANQIRFYDISMESTSELLDECVVVDYKVPMIDKDRTVSGGTVTQEMINKMPNRSVNATAMSIGGVYSRNGKSGNVRGARGPGISYYQENTESYDVIIENMYRNTVLSPLSTFSIDVDGASYSNMRRFISSGLLPPENAVRIEEMINYFSYDYPSPQKDVPFSVTAELAPCPWNENQLLHIGIQGEKIDKDDLPPGNLVFLIDVSGSMDYDNKLPLLKRALRMLVEELREEDRISIVVYAGSSGLALESTKGSHKSKILEVLDDLSAGGSTAGGEGIQLAYDVARKNYMKNGNNRVILATDGDFNVGITDDKKLIKLIEAERDDGIFLSILGFGTGNIKDSKMEKLADHGNGNYSYIDNILEAEKVLVSEMGGTLFTIAKDVKIQIEFNPSNVIEYRLIGYENRMLADEDFNNDRKDAGDIGAGQTVTALYEIVTEIGSDGMKLIDELRYQRHHSVSGEYSDELANLKVRYKEPDGKESKLIMEVITRDVATNPSENFSFSAAVAEFGLLLRDSQFKGEASYKHVVEMAKASRGDDENGYRAEFIRLVRLSKNMF